jgi:hypothetical protein
MRGSEGHTSATEWLNRLLHCVRNDKGHLTGKEIALSLRSSQFGQLSAGNGEFSPACRAGILVESGNPGKKAPPCFGEGVGGGANRSIGN